MSLTSLLTLAAALTAANAAEPPTLILADAPRPDRARLEMVLLGEPWPDVLARSLLYSGAGERTKHELDAFLDGRGALWAVQGREFGAQLTIECREGDFAEVLEALSPAILEPRWTDEALGMASVEALLASTPDGHDPLQRFDRQLAALVDPSVDPGPLVEVDLAALLGGDERGDGDDRGEGPGDRSAPNIGRPGPEAVALEARWRALAAGPVAARLSSAEAERHAPSVERLLNALVESGRDGAPSTAGRLESDRRLFACSSPPNAPGAILGWVTPLGPTAASWSDRFCDAWARALRAEVGARLGDALLPGTAARVVVRRPGEGVPSVRVLALVDPSRTDLLQSFPDWIDGATSGPSIDSERFAAALAADPDGHDPGLALARAARSIGALDLPPADAWPDPAGERFLAMVPDDVSLSAWYLDRTPLEGSSPDAREAVAALGARLGGVERWANLGSVSLTTVVAVSPELEVTTVQWRDLAGDRFELTQLGDPQVVTRLTPGGGTQSIGGAAQRALPAATVRALTDSHRSSLLVSLRALLAGELRVELDEQDPLRLRLSDLRGPRGVLVLGADGLPAALESGPQRYRYSDWVTVEGRQVPTVVERDGARPVVYRWSDFDWNAAEPAGL
jgi:hypothetical protein